MKTKKVLQMIATLLIVSILSCKKDSATGGNPSVISTDPKSNLTGVPRNKEIAFTFSEAMDSSTINNSTFTLQQGSTPVLGTVTYSGTTAIFTPSTILAPGTPYTATINTGAKNKAGIGLAVNTVWNFTTGGNTSTLGVVNLGAAGNYVIVAKT